MHRAVKRFAASRLKPLRCTLTAVSHFTAAQLRLHASLQATGSLLSFNSACTVVLIGFTSVLLTNNTDYDKPFVEVSDARSLALEYKRVSVCRAAAMSQSCRH